MGWFLKQTTPNDFNPEGLLNKKDLNSAKIRRVIKIGIVEECEQALKELEERGIKYPDPLYIKIKTIKTTLDGIKGQFKEDDSN